MGLDIYTTISCDLCNEQMPQIRGYQDHRQKPPKGWRCVVVLNGTTDAWFCPDHSAPIIAVEDKLSAKLSAAEARARELDAPGCLGGQWCEDGFYPCTLKNLHEGRCVPASKRNPFAVRST